MFAALVILVTLSGCTSPAPTRPGGPDAAARAKAKGKGKGGPAKHAPGKGKAKNKAKAAPTVAPIGAVGDLSGSLVLTPVEPAPAPPAPEGTTAPPPPARSEARLDLTWADGGQASATLGSVVGACALAPVSPIGAPGKEQTPLWSVGCSLDTPTGPVRTDLHVLQVGADVIVVKAMPGPAGTAGKLKPVKRVPIVPGGRVVVAEVGTGVAVPAPAPLAPAPPVAPAPAPPSPTTP